MKADSIGVMSRVIPSGGAAPETENYYKQTIGKKTIDAEEVQKVTTLIKDVARALPVPVFFCTVTFIRAESRDPNHHFFLAPKFEEDAVEMLPTLCINFDGGCLFTSNGPVQMNLIVGPV